MARPVEVEPIETQEMWAGDLKSVFNHDAFGIIRLSRTQIGGKGERLFGSDLRHRETFAIEISRASTSRHLNRDWTSEKDAIVRFEMSTAQWAQFISSQGMGEGTPITLVRAPAVGTPMEAMPSIATPKATVNDMFKAEFAAAAQKMGEDVKRAQAKIAEMIASKKPASIKQLAELSNMLIHAGQNAPGHFKHIDNMFTEVVETRTLEAKAEVEGYVASMVTRTGIEALRNSFPVLEAGSGEDIVIDQEG